MDKNEVEQLFIDWQKVGKEVDALTDRIHKVGIYKDKGTYQVAEGSTASDIEKLRDLRKKQNELGDKWVSAKSELTPLE